METATTAADYISRDLPARAIAGSRANPAPDMLLPGSLAQPEAQVMKLSLFVSNNAAMEKVVMKMKII